MRGLLGYLIAGDLLTFAMLAVTFVVAISVHEYGHALAADLQGDPTARLAGRLTLNPKSHLDPIGTLVLLLAPFGWGRPVPFSPAALRSRRFGAAVVGLAGPATNLALAVAAAALLRLATSPSRFAEFLLLFLTLNVALAVFNLIPLPPLDGSRVLSAVLPPSRQSVIYFLDRWGFLLLILVLFILPTRVLLGPIIGTVAVLILQVAGP